MTDKTDLLEQAASIISCGSDYRGILDMDKAIKLKSLFIESEEAREYWREHDSNEPNVLLTTHIKRLKREKKIFIRQACEAVDEVFNNGNYVNANRFDVKQAIRDKFR